MTLAALHSLDFHFDWSLMGPPLLAGLLVASTHVLLGRRVLERGIIFIDLTIAQVAALGVILAGVDEDSGGIGTQIAAAVAARSEEHTSELQSLMRISYAVFCL